MITYEGWMYEQLDVKDEPWFERTRNTGWWVVDEIHTFCHSEIQRIMDLVHSGRVIGFTSTQLPPSEQS